MKKLVSAIFITVSITGFLFCQSAEYATSAKKETIKYFIQETDEEISEKEFNTHGKPMCTREYDDKSNVIKKPIMIEWAT